MKKVLVSGILIALGFSAYGYLSFRTVEFVPEVSTVRLVRGDILDTVGAVGALEAVTTVQVGSQVSGIIEALYADFNSIVRVGDVIARLEPSLFEMQTEQARANLARAEAEVERLRVTLQDTQAQLTRSEDLAAKDLISDSEFEAAQIAVRSAEAQLKSSEASATQSRASLNQSEVSLGHTVITAPIDGIVIARQVDVGQTVAASMSAPELFIIAADLTEMQVIANIDESDVGRIRPGQPVTFTVDAYTDEQFTGRVSQVRLEPVLLQNVVTYATVIDVPNNELKLKPGMTATVTLEIARRENVLRVPTSALRFRPTPAMFAALNQPVPELLQQGTDERRSSSNSSGSGFGDISDARRQAMREQIQRMTPEQRAEFFASRRRNSDDDSRGLRGQPRGRNGRGGSPQRTEQRVKPAIPAVERGATTIDALFSPLEVPETNGRVWVLSNDRLRPVDVKLGVTDGTATELLAVSTNNSAVHPSQPPQDVAMIAELRQQVAALDDPDDKQNLERLIQRLEADRGPASSQISPPPATADTLDAGAQLVTSVTTQATGAPPPSQTGGSPLIPQFGRGRRR